MSASELFDRAQWLWLAAALSLSSGWAGLRTYRVFGAGRAVLFYLATLPSIHACLLLGRAPFTAWLGWDRLWAVPVPTLFGAFLCMRVPREASPGRRWALSLWIAAIWLLGCAIAGPSARLLSQRVSLVLALDASASSELVPNVQSRIRRELELAERNMAPADQLAVVRFGAEARLSSPLRQRDQPALYLDAPIAPEGTNLEAALRRAVSELQSDGTRRIALLSDGIANRGSVHAGIEAARRAGIPVDTITLERDDRSNVHLSRLLAPDYLSLGETLDLRVTVHSPAAGQAELLLSVDGRLLRRYPVTLPAGDEAFVLRDVASSPGLHAFAVEVVVSPPLIDSQLSDNRLTEFVQVAGPSRVLLLEAEERAPSAMERTLRDGGFLVTVTEPEDQSAGLDQLLLYDLVAIGAVPAERMSATLIGNLERYVRDLGGGLLMLGSPYSLTAGGYGATALETVSPLSFDVRQRRRKGRFAQVVLVDDSGSMAATLGGRTKLELAHEAVLTASALLDDTDWFGIVHTDKRAQWTVPMATLGSTRAGLAARLRNVGPGGGGIAAAAGLHAALPPLLAADAALKQLLIVADGNDTEQLPEALRIVRRAYDQGVTTSVVALGAGRDVKQLAALAQLGHGQFYVARDPATLPALLSRATLAACQASVQLGSSPVVAGDADEILRGVDLGAAPALEGFVVTQSKPRARVALRSGSGDPVLATWSLGLGRAGVFASDYGGPWSTNWVRWNGGPQILLQTVRRLARSPDDPHTSFQVTIDGGQLEVRADMVDDNEHLDETRLLGVDILTPDSEVLRLPLNTVGRGRYALSGPVVAPGIYWVVLRDLARGVVLARSGVESRTGSELTPGTSDPEALRRIAQETGGITRDTLASVFTDARRWAPAKRDLTTPCLALGALFCLLAVAVGQLAPLFSRGLVPLPSARLPSVDSGQVSSERPLTTNQRLLQRRSQRTKPPEG